MIARDSQRPWASAAAVLAATLCAHCGASDSTPIPVSGASEVQVDGTVPTPSTWSETGALTASAGADAVGTTQQGTVVAVIDGDAFAVVAGTLEARQTFADPGSPSDLGQVRRIRPRADGGAWLATDTGLWSATGLYVRYRPTALPSPGLRDVADVADGAFAGLWMAADDGVSWMSGGRALRIEGGRPADRVAVASDAALLVQDGEARVLTTIDEQLFITDAPFDDAPLDVAATERSLWAATAGGLYRYGPDGAWTLFTLADGTPASVLALAVRGNDLWARTPSTLVRIRAGVLTAFASVGRDALAVDQLGDVYALSDDGLAHASTGAVSGEVTTFAVDVRPWIDVHCAACHGNQTQDFRDYEVFRSVAEDALTRVRSGDMPRCDGGVRCAPTDNLSPEEYSVLEQWLRAGLPE